MSLFQCEERQFYKQLYRHQPEYEIMGDCYRTCIANIFGLMPWEVPHFNVDYEADASSDWLEELGFQQFYFQCGGDLDNALWELSLLAPGELFILSGESRTRVNHSVLARDGEIIHDPSLTNAGIIGPIKRKDYFNGEFILKEMTPVMREILNQEAA